MLINEEQNNIMMLAVLGLYETIELFESEAGYKYWVSDGGNSLNIIGNNYEETHFWPFKEMLKDDTILSFLALGKSNVD